MDFIDAFLHFFILAGGFAIAAFFFPAFSQHLAEKIFYLGFGLFYFWWQTKPKSQFSGRICRFFKAIPRCWAESKEE